MCAAIQRWVQVHPLLVLALGAVMAVIAVDAAAAKIGLVLPWLQAGAFLMLVLAVWRPRFGSLLLVVVLVFACVHGHRLQETHLHPLRALLQSSDAPGKARLQGSLLPAAPADKERAAPRLMKAQSVQFPNGMAMHVPALMRVMLPRGMEFLEPGTYEIEGLVQLPRRPMNPGQFDAVEHGLRTGVVAEVRAFHCRFLEPVPLLSLTRLQLAAEACRAWIIRQLTLDLESDPETTAVLQAMALGLADAAEEEVQDAFRDSGTLHVFAVSGLHVGLVAAVGWMILRRLHLRRSTALLVLLALVFGYAFVTGWRPSAARAAIMVAAFIGASAVERRASLQNSLGAAALLLLAADPHQLFLPGFQLSFAVLWAIAIGSARFQVLLKPWTQLDPFLPPTLASATQRGWSGIKQWLAALMSVSAAAWLGSLPLMLWHFHTLTPVALVANCFLVPLSFICIFTTCLALCMAAVGLTGAQVLLNNANWAVARLMTGMAAWFSAWPAATIQIDTQLRGQAPPVEVRVLSLSSGAAASHLRVGGAHWLIDTGHLRQWRGAVRPYLASQGVNHIDGLILSHADIRHIGAASLVVHSLRPRVLMSSCLEPWGLDPSFAAMRQIAQDRSILWERLRVDQEFTLGSAGGMKLDAKVLYPAHLDLHDRADDRGLVLLMRMGAARLLWLADAGFIIEKKLLERPAEVRCDILIRSQHASDFSGLGELLLAANPQVVIASSDARFPTERLPEPLREHCARHGITLLDTDVVGAVHLVPEKGSNIRVRGLYGGDISVQPGSKSRDRTQP